MNLVFTREKNVLALYESIVDWMNVSRLLKSNRGSLLSKEWVPWGRSSIARPSVHQNRSSPFETKILLYLPLPLTTQQREKQTLSRGSISQICIIPLSDFSSYSILKVTWTQHNMHTHCGHTCTHNTHI